MNEKWMKRLFLLQNNYLNIQHTYFDEFAHSTGAVK